MTVSSEPASKAEEGSLLGGAWRQSAELAQRAVVPTGEVVVTCSAPVGVGGLGRHLEEVANAVRGGGGRVACIAGPSDRADRDFSAMRHTLGVPYLHELLGRVRVPVSPGVRTRAFMTQFDAYAAQRLPDAEHLIAFNGQALTQHRTARRAGYRSVALVSANSHLRRVIRQHARARELYPLERSWASGLVRRNEREYALADRIYVGSRYVQESFLEEGFPEELLARFQFTPHPRYRPAPAPATQGRFEIVYIGSLAVHKGVPLLIDAVRRLAHADLALTLIGGWGSRGMRRFVQAACAADSRIVVAPGDPLPHLRRAALCVHPSYEDGFAYAPAEALACGVPVLVSEDTGMKELIDSPSHGLTLPTGDLDALAQAIDAAYRGELFPR
jgi:glycosyltransferase involved in cell wall biosynthesis